MSEGYVDFKVAMGKWKTAFHHDVKGDLSTFPDTLSITHAVEGVDALLAEALQTILDLGKIERALHEGGATLANQFATLSSRKFGKTLNEVCDNSEWQAKEKKMIQEMIRLFLTRKILREGGWDVNYGRSTSDFSTGKVSEGNIQFIANYDAWKCIKKFSVTPEMNRRTLAEFIISYSITLDLRFETYLSRVLKLVELEKYLTQNPGKSASVEELVAFLSGKELSTIIQKISTQVAPQYQSACVHTLRAYAARKVLKEKGLFVEAIQVKSLPGWKRVVGKRK
ncbi:MAG: hypothetical protein FJY86_04380 [Candidatus Diapherotrites archaeon]|uniref:Uncharacterized protein n=1 Tax=Candidatus Iainarchaeum sp. TaxID=3101447 RepID=A0A8T4CBP8_9ARCH|nr:hypothetical protein [Candidatus Diapherotrites archaeon]